MANNDWKDSAAPIGSMPDVDGPTCKVCHYEAVEVSGAVCEHCMVKYDLTDKKGTN